MLFYFAHHFNNSIGFEYNPEGFELWRNITGGLVIPLMKAYEKDETAKRIVHLAVDSLVEQHYGAFVTSKQETFEPVVLFGGVFNHNPKFVELFKDRLQKKYDKKIIFITRFSKETMRPACGALLLALSNSKTQELKLPGSDFIHTVYENQKNTLYSEILKNN